MDKGDRPPDHKRPAVRLVDAALSAATTTMRSAIGTSEHEKDRNGSIALVLSGGIGLGAYQAGAALSEETDVVGCKRARLACL